MLVTRETDYAVRTVLYLAQQKDRIESVANIAHAMHIPKSFLAKILQRLVRSHILTSSRGAKGGFLLGKEPSEISLQSIIKVIQGPAGINVCAIRCKMGTTCANHPVWEEIRKEVEKRLKWETVDKLISK